MRLKRSILVIIISGLNRVDEMMNEESAEIERVEERNQEIFEVFVRDFEGRTTVVEVNEDDTGKEVIERLLSKKPILRNTCLRMNHGPKPKQEKPRPLISSHSKLNTREKLIFKCKNENCLSGATFQNNQIKTPDFGCGGF